MNMNESADLERSPSIEEACDDCNDYRDCHDTDIQLESFSYLVKKLDFLLKIWALAFLLMAVAMPMHLGIPAYTNTMKESPRRLVENVFYSSTFTTICALVVLIVLVATDVKSPTLERFFLIVHAIFLILAGLTQFTYIVMFLPQPKGVAEWKKIGPIRHFYEHDKKLPFNNDWFSTEHKRRFMAGQNDASDYDNFDEDDRLISLKKVSDELHATYNKGEKTYKIFLEPILLFLAAISMIMDYLQNFRHYNKR